ncbi:MAG: CHAD domain-containing protein [Candidatus Sedimenticola sp. (ex Thyasira tokunagai)]
MAELPIQYQIADDHSIDEIVTTLSSHFYLGNEPKKVVRRIYCDTFDWRIYQAGAVLYEEHNSSGHWLVWRYLGAERPKEMLRLDGKMPRFSWDFPPGLLRDLVTPEVAMRALLPQVEVRSQVRVLKLFDQQEKTVLRLALEEHGARLPNKGEYISLTSTVQVMPVRGYPKPLARMVRFLSSEMKMQPVTGEQINAALAVVDRQPVDYSSKLDFKLKQGMRADAVAREIHLHLLSTMETNLPGTRADLDSEFLHDLRVAVRRTRSALTQVKGVFPTEVVERYKERFAWVGQVTSPTRDMDVYLLDFGGYRDSLPDQFRDDLEPLQRFLLNHQKSEHRAMVRKLNSPHFHSLVKEWRSYLESPLPEDPDEPNASRVIREVASKRIYSIYRRVMKEGAAITPLSPADDLHELRKSCKKLRYLLEFFQSLYPRKQIRPLIKAQKVLLDNLGDFQDLEVQANKLRDYAHQMIKEEEVPADTLLAMGMLVDSLLKRQQEAREEFSTRFNAFAEREIRATFQSLFATKEKREKRA